MNGIPYSTLNRAEQVRLAVEVAKLRAGAIPWSSRTVWRRWTRKRYKLLTTRLRDEGIQAVVTTVSDDPALTIETD